MYVVRYTFARNAMFRDCCVKPEKETGEKMESLDRYPSVESRQIGRRTAAGNDRSGPPGEGGGREGGGCSRSDIRRGSGTGFDSELYVPRGYPLGTEVFAREIYRRRPGGFIVTAALEGIVNPRLRIADTKFYVGH